MGRWGDVDEPLPEGVETEEDSPTRTSALPGQLWKPRPACPATVLTRRASTELFL